jgi:hypothetical protein
MKVWLLECFDPHFIFLEEGSLSCICESEEIAILQLKKYLKHLIFPKLKLYNLLYDIDEVRDLDKITSPIHINIFVEEIIRRINNHYDGDYEYSPNFYIELNETVVLSLGMLYE